MTRVKLLPIISRTNCSRFMKHLSKLWRSTKAFFPNQSRRKQRLNSFSGRTWSFFTGFDQNWNLVSTHANSSFWPKPFFKIRDKIVSCPRKIYAQCNSSRVIFLIIPGFPAEGFRKNYACHADVVHVKNPDGLPISFPGFFSQTQRESVVREPLGASHAFSSPRKHAHKARGNFSRLRPGYNV